jgi:hypothetical protein
MMPVISRYFLTVLILVFANCANKTVSKATLIDYVKDERNGTCRSTTVNGTQYKITYRPIELILEQELKANSGYNKDSLRTVYSDCLYFVLSMNRDSTEIFGRLSENYETLLKQVSFGLQELVTLKDKDQVFFLADYAYPRMYGGTGSTSVLLCFHDPKLKELEEFTIDVKDFLNQSEENLQFQFSKQDLDHIPDLKL